MTGIVGIEVGTGVSIDLCKRMIMSRSVVIKPIILKVNR